jgi:TfoX/Sxy family transcriptional regulator of competence genes
VAYIEEVADRVRIALRDTPNVTERRMFGSLGFMVNGHLTIGVGDGSDGSVVMVRVGKEAEKRALQHPGASTTIMRGKEMHGWIDLSPEAVDDDADLEGWVDMAISFVSTLPPKDR